MCRFNVIFKTIILEDTQNGFFFYHKSLDTDDFFKRTPGVEEKQAIVPGNTVTQSVSRGERIQFNYKNKKKM